MCDKILGSIVIVLSTLFIIIMVLSTYVVFTVDTYTCVKVKENIIVCTPEVEAQYQGLEIQEWETNKRIEVRF